MDSPGAAGGESMRRLTLREGNEPMAQHLSKDEAVEIATRDAAGRAGVGPDDVAVAAVKETTFPNAALGAQRPGEMSFEVMRDGWTIRLAAGGRSLEYRADP